MIRNDKTLRRKVVVCRRTYEHEIIPRINNLYVLTLSLTHSLFLTRYIISPPPPQRQQSTRSLADVCVYSKKINKKRRKNRGKFSLFSDAVMTLRKTNHELISSFSLLPCLRSDDDNHLSYRRLTWWHFLLCSTELSRRFCVCFWNHFISHSREKAGMLCGE